MDQKKMIQNKISDSNNKGSKTQGCIGLIALVLIFWVGCKFCGSEDNAELGSEKIIPGLEAADVYVNFENKGFDLDRSANATSATWNCTLNENGNMYEVEISGKTSEELQTIKGSVTFQNRTTEVVDFIAFSATFPYDGAEPKEASDWARRNFDNHGADTTIGKVRMVITAAVPSFRRISLYGQ